MIDSYKTPKPIDPEAKEFPEEKEKDESFRQFSQFTDRMIAQGMERALEVLKKRVI